MFENFETKRPKTAQLTLSTLMFRTNHRLIIPTYVIFSLGSFWSMIQAEITFWIFLILYGPYCMVLYKQGCVFLMVIWPAFRMEKYRVNDHPYHAPQFSKFLSG